MWGTFVRDCLCVWAVIFLNVCHSQRDGTVLHMLCNSQLELNCQNSVTFSTSAWKVAECRPPCFWHFKCSLPERWELQPDVVSAPPPARHLEAWNQRLLPRKLWFVQVKEPVNETKQKNSSSAFVDQAFSRFSSKPSSHAFRFLSCFVL